VAECSDAGGIKGEQKYGVAEDNPPTGENTTSREKERTSKETDENVGGREKEDRVVKEIHTSSVFLLLLSRSRRGGRIAE